jgi:hypothetical protein
MLYGSMLVGPKARGNPEAPVAPAGLAAELA